MSEPVRVVVTPNPPCFRCEGAESFLMDMRLNDGIMHLTHRARGSKLRAGSPRRGGPEVGSRACSSPFGLRAACARFSSLNASRS